MSAQEVGGLWKMISTSALVASLCCAPSVLLVGLGLMSVSAGAALSDDLYFGPVRWILYGMTIVFLSIGLVQHFRKQGICDLDAAKRERKRIVNTTLMVFSAAISVYLVWNYLILELLGIAVGLPWAETAFWN